MRAFASFELIVCWAVWCSIPLFRAPLRQNRPSVTATPPTIAGLLLELASYAVALGWRAPQPAEQWRLVASMVIAPGAVVLFWNAVAHLGKQFRIRAGLYIDHQLVRTGAYAYVRHPIYASMLGMLLATSLLATAWPAFALSLVLFVAGTEIRVHTEDALLAARFQGEFAAYKKAVPAYIPFVR